MTPPREEILVERPAAPPPLTETPDGVPAMDAGALAAAIRHGMTRAVLLAAALVAAAILAQELVTLVVAGLITIIVAIAFSAVADPLERRGVPRPIGALAGLLLLLLAIGLALALVIPALVSQVEQFVEELPERVDDLAAQLGAATNTEPGAAGARVQRSLEDLIEDPMKLLGPVAQVGLGIAGIVSGLLVILLIAYYMAARPEPLVGGLLRLFPPARRDWAENVLRRMRAAWAGWMKGVAVDMAVTFVLLYAGLMIIGLDYAVLFAALAGVLVVVPYFGAIIGAIPPLLVALTVSPELFALTAIVYLAVQQVESNVIVPLIMARAVRLHPALIAIGVVVVSQLFGVIGLFVAVPILSAVVILVEELWVRPMEEQPARRVALPRRLT